MGRLDLMIFPANSPRILPRGRSRRYGPRGCARLLCHGLRSVALAVLLLHSLQSRAGELAVDVVRLPPLRIAGQPARAHTQGLELAAGHYYVTARRDDIRPRRALLLRTAPARIDWDVWDITPVDAQNAATALDHPGGMQSDGKRLWIPLAESRRNGRSIIRLFALEGMTAGRPLKPEFEFSVSDHIGALAVDARRGFVLGANWDTETVYVWDFEGHLQRTLTGADLRARGLGMSKRRGPSRRSRSRLEVQGARLLASGLFARRHHRRGSRRAGCCRLTDSWKTISKARCWAALAAGNRTCERRDGRIWRRGLFLPEDLGASTGCSECAARSCPSRISRVELNHVVGKGIV
jgi:hypothetical protein